MSTLTDTDLTRRLDEAASACPVPAAGPQEIHAATADKPRGTPLLRRRWVQLSAAASVVLASTAFVLSARAPGVMTEVRPVPQAGLPIPSKALSTAPGLANSAGVAGGNRTGGAGAAAPDLGSVVNAPSTDDGVARVVKSGSIALVVKDKRVTATLSAVQEVARVEGGYVSASSTDEYGDNPSGEITIRVPVNRFEDLLAKVRGLDAKIRTESTSGRDVTAEYTDLESQLRTLRASRERFLLILSRASTIGEILTVQQRVDDVSAQIDRIEGQHKLLASQSDLATLVVSVSQASDPVVKVTDKPRSGFSQALQDAKDGFIGGVEGIIRHSGGSLLFLLCLGLVLVVGRLSWRLARRTRV